ncbi:MAG: aspartate/glutamate racemase family protein [Granulosicoccus sp.]
MRLLIVNPNTSLGVTRRIDAAAQAVAFNDDVFTTVPAAFGPELIVTDQDGVDAVDGVMVSVDAHVKNADGIVLASFGDTGTEAVRLAYPDIPVVGIASAAFASARCLGGKFSIVTFDEALAPALHTRALFYGLGDQLLSVKGVSDRTAYDAAEVQDERFEAINALCIACAEDAISSIILGGGPLAGLASRVATSVGVPVIDGTQAAIGILRGAIN